MLNFADRQEFENMLRKAGFELLDWMEYMMGYVTLYSARPIRKVKMQVQARAY